MGCSWWTRNEQANSPGTVTKVGTFLKAERMAWKALDSILKGGKYRETVSGCGEVCTYKPDGWL